MRKIVSILLLCVLLFNWFGYQLLTSFIEDKANTHLEARIDEKNYKSSELILIKIPVLSLPYYNNSGIFERVDGHIEIAGILYKYVEKRFYHDSLELRCIPNHTAMELRTAKEDFFKLVNDLQQTNSGKKADSHSGPQKNFLTGFFTVADFFSLHNSGLKVSKSLAFYPAEIKNRLLAVIDQPPENG